MRPLLVVLVLLAGCGSPTAPRKADFIGLQRLDPPPAVYEEWYADTADCLNVVNRFEDVLWWSAESINAGAIGLQQGDWIVIDRNYVLWRRAIRHESAHHLLPNVDIHFNSGKRALCDGG